MNKLNRKSAAMMKGRRTAVPIIDLSQLNQSKQSDMCEISNQGQVDMINLVQPMAQGIGRPQNIGLPSFNVTGHLTSRQQSPRAVRGGGDTSISTIPIYNEA